MRIRVGLIGSGWSASAQAFSLSSLGRVVRRSGFPEVELRVVFSRTPAHAEALARQYGFEKWTTSESEFFGEDLDVVGIASPNNTHYPYALRALERGFNVVLEKPVAFNAREAEEIERYSRRVGRSVAVCLVSRFTPGIQVLRDLVVRGELGDFLEFRGVIAHAKHAYKDTPFEWRMDRSVAGGGVFADIGVHVLDLSEYVTGGRVRRVFGKVYTLVGERVDPATGLKRRVDTEDIGFAVLEYEAGAVGSVEASKVSPGFEEQMRVEVYGDRGGARFSLSEPHVLHLYRRETGRTEKIVKGYEEIYGDLAWPLPKSFEGWVFSYVILYKTFFEYLSGLREDYHPTISDGVRSQKLLDAVYESSSSGKWIEV
ncbi:Gfo/Idh/MocA family protein [Thermofilum pendens]|uniref:Oxidoreductase domain protein n=1 Tax=Thermofilum pendens (strain DSM 2475 / Hrk 5) TaxID=368408 RepID=A1RZ65_THEPD|nr:Gfo/Idh/MocA family oxidoreductase [Thermofilum pendens]ABL78495.1 oxidoreductase domain protein [Thermofilum pendens Hrk 5]